jgi:hypothetical protein
MIRSMSLKHEFHRDENNLVRCRLNFETWLNRSIKEGQDLDCKFCKTEGIVLRKVQCINDHNPTISHILSCILLYHKVQSISSGISYVHTYSHIHLSIAHTLLCIVSNTFNECTHNYIIRHMIHTWKCILANTYGHKSNTYYKIAYKTCDGV